MVDHWLCTICSRDHAGHNSFIEKERKLLAAHNVLVTDDTPSGLPERATIVETISQEVANAGHNGHLRFLVEYEMGHERVWKSAWHLSLSSRR